MIVSAEQGIMSSRAWCDEQRHSIASVIQERYVMVTKPSQSALKEIDQLRWRLQTGSNLEYIFEEFSSSFLM
jgi:hypothetical protein